LSHLHPDHFLGLPGLLLYFGLTDRKSDITIIGPSGTYILVKELLKSSKVSVRYPIKIVEVQSDSSYKIGDYTLFATKALHHGNALSFVLRSPMLEPNLNYNELQKLGIQKGTHLAKIKKKLIQEGKFQYNEHMLTAQLHLTPPETPFAVAYSGDTKLNPDYAEFIRVIGAKTLLIHEATYTHLNEKLAQERNHSTFADAIKIAILSQADFLYFTHISSRTYDVENEKNLAISQVAATIDASKIFTAFDGLRVKYP
jgi:ribonuclease Z